MERPRKATPLASIGLALHRLAPILVLILLAATSLAILGAAGETLGYDFQAYAQAADRLLAGQPLYDPAVDVAGGFAIYLYPPPFALAVIPFAALPDPAGTWAWLGFLVGCFLVGTALLPVRPDRPLGRGRPRRPQLPIPLRPEAGPGRADPLPVLRRRVALAGPARCRSGSPRPSGRWSSCSPRSSSAGWR